MNIPDSVFAAYRSAPRSLSLAPALARGWAMALLAVPGAVVVGCVLGIPTSFMRRGAHAMPWEPSHVLSGAAIWTVVLLSFVAIAVYFFGRYVWLFRTGTLVTGEVIDYVSFGQPVRMVRVPSVGGREGLAMLLDASVPVGSQIPVVVSAGGGNLAILVLGDRVVQRASFIPPDRLNPP